MDFLEYINILLKKYFHLIEYSFLPCKNQDWRRVKNDMDADQLLIGEILKNYKSRIMVPVYVICFWDTNSSILDTKVPEKSQGSFKYVKQNSTMREIFRQWCGEEDTLEYDLSSFAERLSKFVDSLNTELRDRVYENDDPYTKLLTDVNCFNESCTDFATSCQESITTIQNFLSFTTEVLEAANMSNIGTRYLEKLLRVLRRTVQLKEQFEQLAKMRDECFSILGLPFIKERQEDVTDYPRYPDYLEHC